MKKIKILCIDIEGGHGGSSRSLFYFLKHIRNKNSSLDINIICKKNSWLEEEYKKMKMTCIIEANIPKYTPLLKFSRNIYQILLFVLFKWPKSYKFRKNLKKFKDYDIIHFNHASLSVLAFWFKLNKIGKKRCMHIRTMPPINLFSKIIYYFAKFSCDDLIYITENEKKRLHMLIGDPKLNEKIIYNPVMIMSKSKPSIIKKDSRFKIGILSNFSYNRGLDRTIEIFENIPDYKKNKFLFIFGGDMKLEKNIPGIPKSFNLFSDFVASKGYSDNFIFLGQLKNPDELLKYINVLLKPTRLNNPWGRDILEALSIGKPVISIGSYKKFVETDKTGLLLPNYNAYKISRWLLDLESKKINKSIFSDECIRRVQFYCNPTKASNQLLKVWLK